MRYLAFLVAILIAILVSGCNLVANSAQTPEPIATDIISQTGKPEIEIISPDTGAEFVVDEQVLVSVLAKDSVGVTRIQMFANNQIVKTVSSESAQGDQELSAILDYVPRTVGLVNLRVQAFRGRIASDPDSIEITVRQSQVLVTSTAITDPGIPDIPNDGVCRVFTNVNLNFRTEPEVQDGNRITTLASGTLLPVIARLPDNSWWKVRQGNIIGWVSGDQRFVTLYGNCSAVPIEQVATQTPPATDTPVAPTLTPVPGLPDLAVIDIIGPTQLTINGGESEVVGEYSITVSNIGLGDSGQFVVEVLVDDQLEFSQIASNLRPNQSIALGAEIAFTQPGTFELVARVDPSNNIPEINETNNQLMIEVEVEAE